MADLPARVVAVQLRHLAIHQHRVVVAAAEHGDRVGSRRGDVASVAEALDHPQRHLLIGGVVVDDQDARSSRPRVVHDARLHGGRAAREQRLQDVEQLRRTHRFDELGVHSRHGVLRAPRRREQDHRQVAQRGVGPHRGRDRGAIHRGHHQVDDRDLEPVIAF